MFAYRTWSEMVNLTAVTTVVLIKGDGELRDRFSLGKRFAGSINVNLPKHSATTFLVPSSTHSQWRYNCCHIWGTNGRSCWIPAGVCDKHVMTCKTVYHVTIRCDKSYLITGNTVVLARVSGNSIKILQGQILVICLYSKSK